MKVSKSTWNTYITALRKINEQAGAEMKAFLDAHNWQTDSLTRQACVDLGYALATKYGEAAGAVACEMYDKIAASASKVIAAAEPAPTATYSETAKAVYGTMKTNNADVVANSISRLVKMAGVDTTMQNAIRDRAEWAWIPVGDTCAFCIALASRGWQKASKSALKGNHAEHIHANCDCTYAIRFDNSMDVEGYDPDLYLKMYKEADQGGSSKDKINAMRRTFYAMNKNIVGDVSDKAEEFIKLNIVETRIKKDLEYDNVEYIKPEKYDSIPDEEEIINRLGGGDKTNGSCASVALAYAGNKAGYDVLDFRGGRSLSVFSKTGSIKELSQIVGGKTINDYNDFKAVAELLKEVKSGKEYFLSTGQHVSIIRKTEHGYEYLELQSARENGYEKLTNDVLKKRFGAKKSHSVYGNKVKVSSTLIDIDLFKDNDTFIDMLGYINTNKANQVKGATGGIK